MSNKRNYNEQFGRNCSLENNERRDRTAEQSADIWYDEDALKTHQQDPSCQTYSTVVSPTFNFFNRHVTHIGCLVSNSHDFSLPLLTAFNCSALSCLPHPTPKMTSRITQMLKRASDGTTRRYSIHEDPRIASATSMQRC
jgi:hypothetical protein